MGRVFVSLFLLAQSALVDLFGLKWPAATSNRHGSFPHRAEEEFDYGYDDEPTPSPQGYGGTPNPQTPGYPDPSSPQVNPPYNPQTPGTPAM